MLIIRTDNKTGEKTEVSLNEAVKKLEGPGGIGKGQAECLLVVF